MGKRCSLFKTVKKYFLLGNTCHLKNTHILAQVWVKLRTHSLNYQLFHKDARIKVPSYRVYPYKRIVACIYQWPHSITLSLLTQCLDENNRWKLASMSFSMCDSIELWNYRSKQTKRKQGICKTHAYRLHSKRLFKCIKHFAFSD